MVKTSIFYQDDENDMMVALLSANDEFDYFGYMKKMMLTLHNVRKINKKQTSSPWGNGSNHFTKWRNKKYRCYG